MLTCRDLIDFLDDYTAGTQPAEVRAEFDRHLAVCRHCREYLQSYRDTIALTLACRDENDPVPAEVPAALVEAVMFAIKPQ